MMAELQLTTQNWLLTSATNCAEVKAQIYGIFADRYWQRSISQVSVIGGVPMRWSLDKAALYLG